MKSKSLSIILVAFAVFFGISFVIASRHGAVSTPDAATGCLSTTT
jgi:hypothetical protein